MADHIRYDLLTQQALRGVVRNVLTDAAKKGLPGDHHFYISFDTTADSVRMSDRLRAQYPEEMTVILQHQFWDLAVTDSGFEVGMSFGGIPEKLAIPFNAITGFFDPSVQFGLQFEEIAEGDGKEGKPADGKKPDAKKTMLTSVGAATKAAPKKPEPAKLLPVAPMPVAPSPVPVPTVTPITPTTTVTNLTPAQPTPEDPTDPDKPSGGGEVVRLDRFRKK